MATAKPKAVRVKLVVTDVNVHANATTLEGDLGDIRLILLKDYDVFGDPTDDKVGDVHHFMLTRITPPAAKVPKPKFSSVQKRAKNAQVKAATKPMTFTRPYMKSKTMKSKTAPKVCLGSGDLFPQNLYGKRIRCDECNRDYMINHDGRMRKHSI